MHSEVVPAYTTRHWAKVNKSSPANIHLLEHHLADVGACFEALLRQDTIRRRLARAGKLPDLDETTVARLCVFAALHDVGKVNVGFQTRIWQSVDFQSPQRRPGRGNHVADLIPVLNGSDEPTNEEFFGALGWWDEATGTWDNTGGETVCGLFVAALSHHGSPLNLEDSRQSNRQIWQPYGNLDPRECVVRLGRMVREWFPRAFDKDAISLPAAPAFQHHFLGLCILADWLGSNERWFPYRDNPDDNYIDHARNQAAEAVQVIGLDLIKQRLAISQRALKFTDVFPFPPNAIQQSAASAPLESPLVIVESETGSGKTEAALWRFQQMYRAGLVDGLYFALPTRSAAAQIYGRVKRFVGSVFPGGNCPNVVLAVPGYDPEIDEETGALSPYNNQAAGHDDHDRPWASENSKRYLAAQVAVGTVDQAMLGALKVRHAHLRSSCLARNLLVVDEVHASDTYMTEVLKALLESHVSAGGYALLMSATLGSEARLAWLSDSNRIQDRPTLSLSEAKRQDYPAVSYRTDNGNGWQLRGAGRNDQAKSVRVESTPAMADFEGTARLALAAARDGARVLVAHNTVGFALLTQMALEAAATETGDRQLLFSANNIPALHHGRFARGDRRLLDCQVEARLGKERPDGGLVVVGTQTLEQSLDIDADLLITDLCPVDVLLQRIGRLHRHRRDNRPEGYREPRCVVLTPSGDDLSPMLKSGQNANGLGPHGYVYRSLHALEATRRLVIERPVWEIPAMNRELVEGATHREALERITEEMGEEWRVHAIDSEGGYIADRLVARSTLIDFGKDFFNDNRDVCFPGNEERIRTRLGDDRVTVKLDPPQPSPFGQGRKIEAVDMTVRWLGGATAPESVTPEPAGDGFRFIIGERGFVYDRLGLRQG